MTNADAVANAVAAVRARSDLEPRLAVVLGSGLGGVADAVENAAAIGYADLPGFPAPGVEGHAGRLLLGQLSGCSVAVLQGRTHYYESGRSDGMSVPLRTLATLGCDRLLLTNAAGSLHRHMGPGCLMALTDHINFSGRNPLIGPGGSDRFVDMSGAYDAALRDDMRAASGECGVELHEGVYAWFSGPSFETPAEARAARVLGADAVGMSTVPETIALRHMDARVVGISAITNLAAGMMAGSALDHAETMTQGTAMAEDLSRLLTRFLADNANVF